MVASKANRDDGFGEYQIYEITATNSSCVARLESFTMGYLPLAGEKIYYEVEVFIAGGAVNLSRAQLYAYEVSTSKAGDIGGGTTPYSTLNVPTDGITITLRTPTITYEANSATPFCRAEVYFIGAGSATVKFSRACCIKVE